MVDETAEVFEPSRGIKAEPNPKLGHHIGCVEDIAALSITVIPGRKLSFLCRTHWVNPVGCVFTDVMALAEGLPRHHSPSLRWAHVNSLQVRCPAVAEQSCCYNFLLSERPTCVHSHERSVCCSNEWHSRLSLRTLPCLVSRRVFFCSSKVECAHCARKDLLFKVTCLGGGVDSMHRQHIPGPLCHFFVWGDEGTGWRYFHGF